MKQLLQILNPDRLFFVIALLFLFQEGVFIDKRVTVDEVWHSVPVYRAQEDGLFTVKAMKEGEDYSKLYQLAGYQSSLILWHSIFPKEILYSRTLSLLFGLLILIFIYILSKRILKNSYWAVLPAALLAFDNLFFITSITVRSDIVIAAGLPLILLVVYDNEWRLRPGKLFAAGIAAIVFSSMHPNFFLAIAALTAGYLIIEAKNFSFKQNLKNIFLFAAPFLTIAIPFLVYSLIIGFDVISFITPYVIKTSELSAVLSLNFSELFGEEWNRYLDFIQFPFRLHLFVILFLSAAASLFFKEKIIKLISVIVFIILILFLLLDSKTVRYFILVLPLLYILLPFAVRRIYLSYKGETVKRALAAALIAVILISLAGNAYLIKKYWRSNYKEFSNALYFKPQDGKNVIGDLILWDTFKNADFSAYPGIGLEINNYDYVIARYGVFGNNNIIMTRTNTFSNADNKKRRDDGYKVIEGAIAERGTLIKEVNHSYYGSFKVYKMNREKE